MKDRFDYSGFGRRFHREVDNYPISDKDAAEESLSQLPDALKQKGISARTRAVIVSAYATAVRDGNPNKTQDALIRMGELVPVASTQGTRRR